MNQTYTFPVVATTAQHSGFCPVCGKRVVRTQRFEMTINPYNRDENGAPKTRERVYEDVKREAAAWLPDFTHAKCVGAAVSTSTSKENDRA